MSNFQANQSIAVVCLMSAVLFGCSGGDDPSANAPANDQPPSGSNGSANSVSSGELPLLQLQQLQYAGAFTVPAGDYGGSNMNYSDGIIEYHAGTMFMVGHAHHDAIAQFQIPDLVNSTNIADLNSTGDPLQVFATVLDRAPGGNTEGMDYITGMQVVDGKLIVNAHEWYDADGTNTDTTMVLTSADDLAGSAALGYFDIPGAARAGGWISAIPTEWQSELDGTHLTGFSAATSIVSRHSVGPSAHAFYPNDVFNASQASPNIATTQLMEFSLAEPLHDDPNNDVGTNNMWTIATGAWYGFIVPGTRTYATFGYLAGRDSGIGYKITQNNGNLCGGYCPYDANDTHPYYWFFDVDDLLRVKSGELAPSAVRPYTYGEFPAPFQPAIGANPIIGGTYDQDGGILYLTLDKANTEQGTYSRTPIIVGYRFNL